MTILHVVNSYKVSRVQVVVTSQLVWLDEVMPYHPLVHVIVVDKFWKLVVVVVGFVIEHHILALIVLPLLLEKVL